jgi:hypothetical protein
LAIGMQTDDILRALLMYFVLPVWLAAGFADYLCHRSAHIERTSGWKESLLHLVQFAEMALPILAAMFLEITSGVVLLMIVCLVLHQATAMWDLSYATQMREVKPIEQHVHSVLEMMPLTGLLLVVALHWNAFIGLFGLAPATFALVFKPEPPSWPYVTTMLGLTALFEVLPYIEELVRGLRSARTDQSA